MGKLGRVLTGYYQNPLVRPEESILFTPEGSLGRHTDGKGRGRHTDGKGRRRPNQRGFRSLDPRPIHSLGMQNPRYYALKANPTDAMPQIPIYPRL